jgi:hypothetical protein
MSQTITKFLTIDHLGLEREKAYKIIYDLKDEIGKDEFKDLYATHNDGNLTIEGKVNINSVYFNLKAVIMLQDNNFRIKYETNAPFALTGTVVSKIRSYLDTSLKEHFN